MNQWRAQDEKGRGRRRKSDHSREIRHGADIMSGLKHHHPCTLTEYSTERQTSGSGPLIFILMPSIQAAAEPGL